MARASRYEQDKVISQLAPVAPVNQSGEIVANTLSNSAQQLSGMMTAVNNRRYAANQAIDKNFFDNISYGLRVREFYKNAAEKETQTRIAAEEAEQHSRDLFLTLDEDSRNAQERNAAQPQKALSEFSAGGPERIDNYISTHGLTGDVAFAVRKAGNSKFKAELERTGNWVDTQRIKNMSARDAVITDKTVKKVGSSTNPLDIVDSLAVEASRKYSYLNEGEAEQLRQKNSNTYALTFANNLATQNPEQAQALAKQWRANGEDDLIGRHLTPEDVKNVEGKARTAINTRDAEELDAAQSFGYDEGRYMSNLRGKVSAYSTGSPQEVARNDAVKQMFRDKIEVWNKQYENPDISQAQKKTLEGLIGEGYGHIRAIENQASEHDARVAAAKSQAEAIKAAARRDITQGRADESYTESRQEKAAKAIRTSPEAQKVMSPLSAKLDFNMSLVKGAKTTVPNKVFDDLRKEVDDAYYNHHYMSDTEYRSKSDDIELGKQLAGAKKAGNDDLALILTNMLNKKAPPPPVVRATDKPEDVSARKIATENNFNWWKLKWQMDNGGKNPDDPKNGMPANQLNAFRARAKAEADAGRDRGDEEIK